MKKNVFAYYPDELLSLLNFQKSYTGRQLLDWLYQKKIVDLNQISNIQKRELEKFSKQFCLISLKLVNIHQSSKSPTKKFLLKTFDNAFIEAVLINNQDNTFTLCLSSQVGCSYDCSFCATGKMKYKRNLEVNEIVEQYLLLDNQCHGKIKNIVFMGMGEPLLNIKNVKKSINILTSKNSLNLSPKKISVSTVGLIAGIKQIMDYSKNINLLISLHSADQLKRDKIMPNLKKQPLTELKKTIEHYNREKKRKVVIEYIMLKNFNDSLEDAAKLKNFLKKLNAKVNLIAYNHIQGGHWDASPSPTIKLFKNYLMKKKIIVTQRFKKGDDIAAACGQLAVKSL